MQPFKQAKSSTVDNATIQCIVTALIVFVRVPSPNKPVTRDECTKVLRFFFCGIASAGDVKGTKTTRPVT
uniref:Uncharacterized protein n=1 Tax=Ixodes ricinus TaxID=34613 RepID=A0A6B0U978_IXORI